MERCRFLEKEKTVYSFFPSAKTNETLLFLESLGSTANMTREPPLVMYSYAVTSMHAIITDQPSKFGS
jgi:hypothetical protein